MVKYIFLFFSSHFCLLFLFIEHTNKIAYKNAHIWCNDHSYHSSWWQEIELKKANEGGKELNYILELLPVYLYKFVY